MDLSACICGQGASRLRANDTAPTMLRLSKQVSMDAWTARGIRKQCGGQLWSLAFLCCFSSTTSRTWDTVHHWSQRSSSREITAKEPSAASWPSSPQSSTTGWGHTRTHTLVKRHGKRVFSFYLFPRYGFVSTSRLSEACSRRRWRRWTPTMSRQKKSEASLTWKDVWPVPRLTSSSSAWRRATRRWQRLNTPTAQNPTGKPANLLG